MEQVLKSMTFDFFSQGLHKITPEKLLGMDTAVFLDVRTHEEIKSMPLPLKMHAQITSLHIPLDELPDRLDEIPHNIPIGVFCPHHVRASIGYAYLRSKEYEQAQVLEGGYAALTAELSAGKIAAAM